MNHEYGATPTIYIMNRDEDLTDIKQTYNDVAKKLVAGTF